MQINGGSITSVFTSKTPSLESKSRPPVVIDSPSFSLAKTSNEAPLTTVVTPISDVASQQQSRFVRAFSTQEDRSKTPEDEQRELPRGVQQYIQVAQLGTQDGQRLLDETV
jgi:hypothetical protein